jgi:putative transposase
VSDHQAAYPTTTMCELLGVSSSGYYAWIKRRPSQRAETDVVLIAEIRVAHEASRGTYGAPRIHAELAAKGLRVGRKRIARLMARAGLAGVSRRRFVTTTVRNGGRQAPDLVERNFTAEAPDRLWVADITTSRHGQAFSISRSCSMRIAVALSAGRWPRHSPNN